MDKRNHFFGEVLDEADVDADFNNVEKAINDARSDVRTPGVIWGCKVQASWLDVNSFFVSPGVIQGPNGERIFIRNFADGNVGGYYDVDTAGVSTDPGTGNCRWVTVCARFGRQMANPATDDLGNTVYTSLRDSWNANGLTYATDATKATNDTHDGGAQTDATGKSFDGFFIVAGPTTGIGGTPAYPSVPADAVILADILYTDGDQGQLLLDASISIGRRQSSYGSDGGRMKSDISSTFERKLLYAATNNNQYNTRFYVNDTGFEVASNCFWDATTNLWNVENPSFSASVVVFNPGGLIFKSNRTADISGGVWTDTNGAGGWVNKLNFLAASDANTHVATMDQNGNVTGNGVQTGYISWGGVVSGSPSNPIGYAAIQFPRAFTSTPSSVTLGSAGPNETNVASVATGNLKTSGCDFTVSATTNAKTVAQRTYTATQ